MVPDGDQYHVVSHKGHPSGVVVNLLEKVLGQLIARSVADMKKSCECT
jgi:hypothetical protein